MLWLLTTSLILLTTYTVNLCLKGKLPKYYKGYKVPDGPSCKPIFGHLNKLLEPDYHLQVEQLKNQYGPIVKIQIGKYPGFIVCDAKLIKEVFQDNDKLSNDRPSYSATKLAFGNQEELFISNGDKWKTNRKIFHSALTKLFNEGVIANIIEDEADYLLSQIADGKSFNGPTLFLETTFNVINRVTVGRRATVEQRVLFKTLQDEFPSPSLAEIIPWIPGLSILLPNQDQRVTNLMNKINPILLDYLHHPESPQTMSCYLRKLGGDDIPDHSYTRMLMDMYVAGYDSVQFHLSWFVLLMVNYPQIQKKLQEDLDKGSKEYFDLCLKEVMRYRPILLSGTWRQANADIFLSNGYVLPKNSLLMYSTWSVHFSSFWSNPHQFDPERFRSLTAEHENLHTLGFFRGPRVYPGEKLAKQEIYLIVKKLFSKFTLVSANDLPLNEETYLSYIMRLHPFNIKAIPRSS